MVVLDAVVVVEIVDHDAEGFLDRTELGVAEPVDPLEPRAVAEVKTRYRVDAVSGRWPSRQVGRTKPQQGCAQRFALLWIVPPAVARELRQQRGTGDSVENRLSCGNSACSSSTTCLIRKLPNETPRSPS